MYVTQTYLGFVSKKAKAYVYFLSETYRSDSQRDLHNVFLSEAKAFGLSTGEEVAVLLPIEGFENSVLGDISDNPMSPLQKFYEENVREHLPGLLICTSPIDTKKGISGAVYISFQEIEHPFRAAKNLVKEIVNGPNSNKFIELLSALNSILILQPNIAGFGININVLIDRLIDNSRSK